MIQFQRLGVVLAPDRPEVRTVAKFNAGMTLAGDVVHMLFRYAEWKPRFDPARESNYAVDEMRYARLTPEGRLLYESPKPLLAPSEPWDVSGCQDARIIPFEGAYYLIYCGWDKDAAPPGQDKARIGIARTTDFLTAEKLGVVTHYTWDKDAYIFPERINGKIAFVHRVSPNIQIDTFDTFDDLLNPKNWENYERRVEDSTVLRAAFAWECGKVGGSVPPIKTEAGWLFIYHAVEQLSPEPLDFIYRAGLALLDLKNPSKVIARLPYPVLEPAEPYELEGDVNRVVFPVGGYLYKDEVYISYGGADRVVALAKAPLSDLLNELAKYAL
ncbi:MAG TPA: hypothetical protein VIO61_16685 [Anaerolineaceae bacterium]